MITTFFRSSSLNSVVGCETEYFINYVLGLPSITNKAAAKGNVVHKAMETFAWKSKMVREGLSEYVDETFGLLKIEDITLERTVQAAYDHYVGIEKGLKWTRRDVEDCKEWTIKALTGWGGSFNPMNQIVVEPEVKFDFTIDEPWAAYSYDSPWGRIEGQLGIKGTTDLLIRDPDDIDVYECIDYKTGRQKDWALNKPKTAENLWHDRQLLLYYYALKRRYPDKHLIMSILFINYDGPFRMFFGEEQYEEAEALLRSWFEEVKAIEVPRKTPEELRMDKCYGFCSYGKRSADESGKTVCQKIRDEIYSVGMDEVMRRHGSLKAVTSYGSGGGRQASE